MSDLFYATICIVTIRPQDELKAALLAFDCNPEAPPNFVKGGSRYWISETTDYRGNRIRIVITCTGMSGNTEIVSPTQKMVDEFSPDCVFLVGIACGVREHELGDVVVGQMVWAYDYVKTTDAGELDRSRARLPPSSLLQDARFFNANSAFLKLFLRLMSDSAKELQPNVVPQTPHIHEATIASGGKVMANGELQLLNKKNNTIRAGEMEAHGFAEACSSRIPGVPWLVIRGISDHGDASKDGDVGQRLRKDEFHYCASLTAACYLKIFVHKALEFANLRIFRHKNRTRRKPVKDFARSVAGVWQTLTFSLSDPATTKNQVIRKALLLVDDQAQIDDVTLSVLLLGRTTYWEGEAHCISRYIYIELDELNRKLESAFLIFRRPEEVLGRRPPMVGMGMGVGIRENDRPPFPIGAAKYCAIYLQEESAAFLAEKERYLSENLEMLQSNYCGQFTLDEFKQENQIWLPNIEAMTTTHDDITLGSVIRVMPEEQVC